jgi:hypothetical protein
MSTSFLHTQIPLWKGLLLSAIAVAASAYLFGSNNGRNAIKQYDVDKQPVSAKTDADSQKKEAER